MNQQFEDILFNTNDIESLAKELSRPFTQLSIIYLNTPTLIEKTRWLSSVTLWENNKVGLKISTIMHDVDYRLEVGSLYFERVVVKDQRDEFYKLPDSFSTGAIIQKLIVTESGKRIESGIRITTSDEAQILLVPNAMPLSISMRCTELNLSHFEPEYSIDEYSVEVF